jgi:hypothetical protein
MSKEKSTPKSQEEELVIQDENNEQEHQTTEFLSALIRRMEDWPSTNFTFISAQEYIDWICKYCNRQDENDENGI